MGYPFTVSHLITIVTAVQVIMIPTEPIDGEAEQQRSQAASPGGTELQSEPKVSPVSKTPLQRQATLQFCLSAKPFPKE